MNSNKAKKSLERKKNKKIKILGIRLPEDIYNLLRLKSEEEEIGISSYVRKIIKKNLKDIEILEYKFGQKAKSLYAVEQRELVDCD